MSSVNDGWTTLDGKPLDDETVRAAEAGLPVVRLGNGESLVTGALRRMGLFKQTGQ